MQVLSTLAAMLGSFSFRVHIGRWFPFRDGLLALLCRWNHRVEEAPHLLASALLSFLPLKLLVNYPRELIHRVNGRLLLLL